MEKKQLIESLEAERDEILRQLKELDDNKSVLLKEFHKLENRIELFNLLRGDDVTIQFVKDLVSELEIKQK